MPSATISMITNAYALCYHRYLVLKGEIIVLPQLKFLPLPEASFLAGLSSHTNTSCCPLL